MQFRRSSTVGGVPEVSQALGIVATTVKTHLERLFEKTGVDRQADLVKVVADLPRRCPAEASLVLCSLIRGRRKLGREASAA
jgi:hypothetical protein